jgi:hypothetical protein
MEAACGQTLTGATSYWASVVANLPRHMSKCGDSSTVRGWYSRWVGPLGQPTIITDRAISGVQVSGHVARTAKAPLLRTEPHGRGRS